MDCSKVGGLIRQLRMEKGMTQRQLADIMNISDKTVSKWERGLGCPDVSLLSELADALQVNAEIILSGDIDPRRFDVGNMKKLQFYICPTCGNVITSMGAADISCCGRKIPPLSPKPSRGEHQLHLEIIDDEYYVTFEHEMTKEHYISFIACVSYDRALLVKLYPEQGGEVRIPVIHGSKLYFCCNRHGLWVNQ